MTVSIYNRLQRRHYINEQSPQNVNVLTLTEEPTSTACSVYSQLNPDIVAQDFVPRPEFPPFFGMFLELTVTISGACELVLPLHLQRFSPIQSFPSTST